MKQRRESGNKKAEYPRIALRPRPDQEPTTPNANRSIRQDHAKKAQSHWTQFTQGVVDKTFFTWSVLDVFAVKCEQFSISRCLK